MTKRRSTGHSGESRMCLDDKGCSKAQAFFRSAEHRPQETNCEASNSPQDNPGITPPQVRYDISIQNADYSQTPFSDQLKHFLNEWMKISNCSDPYILQCISNCPLEV